MKLEIKPEQFEHIESIALTLCRLASLLGIQIECVFEDIEISCSPEDVPDEILAKLYRRKGYLYENRAFECDKRAREQQADRKKQAKTAGRADSTEQ